jgi:hypothetical protein
LKQYADTEYFPSSSWWYLAFKLPDRPTAAYVQVEVPVESERLSMRVFTAFFGTGISIAEVKNSIKAETRARYDGFDGSTQRITTVAKTFEHGPKDPLTDLIRAVAAEVERQAPLANELRDIVKAKLSTGGA